MFEKLIELIQQKGLRDTILNPEYANRMYKKVPASIDRLWAVQNLLGGIDGGENIPDTEFEVTAAEHSFGTAKAIAENGTANVVDKLGQKSVKIEGVKYSEVINFSESNIVNIMRAINQPGNMASLALAARAFITNGVHLRTRLFTTLEKLFWDGVINTAMTIEVSDGTSLDILTGTRVLSALTSTAKWDAPTTADPFKNLRDMAESFIGTGFVPDTVIMSTFTYNKMVSTAEFKAQLTEIERSMVAQNKKLTTIGDYTLLIYDGGYKATRTAANLTYFVPAGKVVMANLQTLSQSPVRRINMLNLDATIDGELRETTGEYFKNKIISDPARVTLNQSYRGILSFNMPDTFCTLTVY